MKLKLFNTMGRKKQLFKPIKKGRVGMYSCGPTVYSYAHIGHFRAYIFVDILKRILQYNKYEVKHVMNITDVGHLTSDDDIGEDKMEKAAKDSGKTAHELAKFFTKNFFDSMKKLNVKNPDLTPKATDHIQVMADLVQKIIDNDYTYLTSDGIYFDSTKLDDYGKLAKLDIKGLEKGKRVDFKEKKHVIDFALWKISPANKKRQMEWKNIFEFDKKHLKTIKQISEKNPNIEILSEKNKIKIKIIGFPGWHIECSAMSMKYLGQAFDIHTGGVDHIPVHHTNEIAQAKAATGKQFVKYWLHNEHVLVKGEKMSKSKGNFYKLDDITEKGFDPLALRYLFLTAHYRSRINFTWKSLKAAEKTLDTLREHIRLLKQEDNKESDKKRIKYYQKKFLEFINDDLNTPLALSLVWELIRKENKINNKDKLKLILDFDKIFGLELKQIKQQKTPKEIKELAEKREKARNNKNWKKADKIRDQIKKKGYILEDSDKGPIIKKT